MGKSASFQGAKLWNSLPAESKRATASSLKGLKESVKG